ncbi:MAG: zinc-ribbon domain-containing protein [Methanobacteriaceae archaeon]|nr:zinc-ribbon domain-containing protein [Methanobacteriaceae archaeon]
MTTYCSKCGEENEDDAKFCRKCGTSLNSNIKKVINSDNKNEDKNKKYIIIGLIVVLACVLIVGGAYLMLNHHNMKTLDFGDYTMSVPDNANMVNNSTDSVNTFIDSNAHLMTASILTDSLSGAVAAAAIKGSFESYPTVTSDKLKVSNCTIHKISNDSSYGYVALYNPTGIYIVVASDNLDDLIEMVNSIQVKDLSSGSSSGSSASSGSSVSSSSNSASHSDDVASEGTVNINGNDYNRVYYKDGTYKTYGTVSGKLYENTHDSQAIDQEPYSGPI